MKPHKWAKEIKAWADGAEIECKVSGCSEWTDVTAHSPSWYEDNEYRIKPQPKEPQYLYVYVYHQEGKGLEIGYAPHEALNMWKTKIVGKIKLETDDE